MDTEQDTTSGNPALARVRQLVAPIVADLGLDLYDLEQRGGTIRITLDTAAGSAGGITVDALTLASRLMSKELDQHDPIPSRYTLEVTSPGVERSLRVPAHFQREIGKVVTVRLANVESELRRLEGEIVAADADAVTIRTAAGDRVIAYHEIDRARTVFEWGGQPKPGTRTKKVTGSVPAVSAGAAETLTSRTAEGSASDEADRGADEAVPAVSAGAGETMTSRTAEGSASDEADRGADEAPPVEKEPS